MTEDLERRFLEATSESLGVIMDLQEELQRVRLDHITTLGELQEAAAEIKRLRAAGDALATNYELMLEQDWSAFSAAFLHEWKEARRWDS